MKSNSAMNCKDHHPYKLIILDNQMPKLSGIQTAKIIRKMQANGSLIGKPKIVLLTGDEHQLEDIETKKVFDEVIIKPIKMQDI